MSRAAYVEAPFRFELRDIHLPVLDVDDVLLDIDSCGVCGSDVHWAADRARTPQPFGHEIAGQVVEAGSNVSDLEVGARVVVLSSTFCGLCDECMRGRVDLCACGPRVSRGGALGFAERMIVNRRAVVVAGDLPAAAASLAEPLGVAQDLVNTGGIEPGHDVLVIGPGPIGLMAIRLARWRGARRIAAVGRRTGSARADAALASGADDYHAAADDLVGTLAGLGHFDRVLVTASPSTIGAAFTACSRGGVVTYNGLDHAGGATITIDADDFHFRKLQLRGSHASPALFLPNAVDLLRRGVIDWRLLVTHQFPLDELPAAIDMATRPEAIKVVVINEGAS